MALSGEQVEEKAQQRIKKLVGNHLHIKELQSKLKETEDENSHLQEQIALIKVSYIIFKLLKN